MAMREILNRALRDMDLLFESMYEERDRYSVPPEWLLRGLVLQGCTESAANGCCASSWATTCCTAGLSVWGWRMRRDHSTYTFHPAPAQPSDQSPRKRRIASLSYSASSIAGSDRLNHCWMT